MRIRFITDEQLRKDKKLGDADGVIKHLALTAVVAKSDSARILQGAVKAGTLTAEPSIELGERQVLFRMSDATLDRYGDTINPKGWVVDGWLKSGSWLWAHDPSQPPIARPLNAFVFEDALYSVAQFPTEGAYAFADTCYKLLQEGTLRGCSVGFKPLEWKFVEPDGERGFGIHFEKCELLECSLTPVPANPNAMAIAKAFGIEGPSRTLNIDVDATQVDAACSALSAVVERAEKVLEGLTALTPGRVTLVLAEKVLEEAAGVTRAGKVLSKANAGKLEQARTLIHEVLDSAQKSEAEDPPEDEVPEPDKSVPEDKSIAGADRPLVDVRSLVADITRAMLEAPPQ